MKKEQKNNKLYYNIFQWSVIILSAVVPVLAAIIAENQKTITIIVSILLAIGTTALKTFKYQENWLNYRSIAETLKKEKYYYDAGIEDYSNELERNARFVERVESLISRENTIWVSTYKQKEIKEGEK
jgi:hypothetical protein